MLFYLSKLLFVAHQKVTNNLSMKLFKFFETVSVATKDAVQAENKFTKHVKDLFRVSEISNLESFGVRNNRLIFSNVDVLDMSKGLKRGDEKFMGKLFKSKTFPNVYKNNLIKQVEHLPDYKFHQNSLFREKFKTGFTTSELRELNSIKSEENINRIAKNPKFQKTFELVKGKNLLSATGELLVIGTSIYLFIKLVEAHRLKTTGCFASVFDTNENKIKMCRINGLSCNGKSLLHSDSSACGYDINNILPADMKGNRCSSSNIDGVHCINCPSDAYTESEATLKEKYNNENFDETEVDRILIECRQPSFFDALTDITNSVSDSLVKNILNMPQTISSIFKYIVIGIISILSIVVVGVVIYFVKKMFENQKRQL